MSIQTEITRLQNLRNALRTKLVELGIASSTAALEDCVTAVEGITDNGAVAKTLDTTAPSYTVPKGLHNGSGVVKIVTEKKNSHGKRHNNADHRQGIIGSRC